jgi:Transglycosylase SLT domain
MRTKKIISLGVGVIALSVWSAVKVSAQGTDGKMYQQMSVEEQSAFVNDKAQRIAFSLSGREYAFTPEFISVVKRSVDTYVDRVDGKKPGRTDLRLVVQRGSTYAAVLSAPFKKRELSPLFGIYLPFIESEYVNLEQPTKMGALGMFQFLPQTGMRYGLTTPELLDIGRSADAAAEYIADSLKLFQADPMKEALALLSYNRGTKQVVQDLHAVVTDQNRDCSICALTSSAGTLNRRFSAENAQYVPGFFAAAIVGENPAAFGLNSAPLSSLSQ